MPVGIIANVLGVLFGGLLGGTVGEKLPQRIKDCVTLISSMSLLSIGITLIAKSASIGVVVLSLILGTVIGELVYLEDVLRRAFSKLNQFMLKSSSPSEEYMSMFLSLLVICCLSGTGIFGALNQGMTGDSSVLIAKAVLDFFTVLVFATTLGKFSSVICIPQAVIFFALFFCARAVMPLLNDNMVANFSGISGIVNAATALRVAKIKDFKVLNILPGMILVFPLTLLWGVLF
ncbi:MAG: DUF554 domain-containing protein [Oscillospiraceae bacterium]|jgi:uncharacterized membrane protein YqgA involved in biofilm formation|nr:DUF554 domain-containing protein [Oscillospiraceae bacterium]